MSTEMQERANKSPYWLKQKFRRAVNIVTLLLIIASFIIAACLTQESNREIDFLLIQDAFISLSSVFYIWTLVNIHTTMARNQIQSDNRVMGLFVVFLLMYVLTTITYSVVKRLELFSSLGIE